MPSHDPVAEVRTPLVSLTNAHDVFRLSSGVYIIHAFYAPEHGLGNTSLPYGPEVVGLVTLKSTIALQLNQQYGWAQVRPSGLCLVVNVDQLSADACCMGVDVHHGRAGND